MQVKKEEVRDKLLNAGFRIFSELGYEKASLRKIAKEAGTTIGNYYNYFDNKEDLFDGLVKEEYEQFLYFLEHHEDEEASVTSDVLMDMNNVVMIQAMITEFISAITPIFTPNFILLVDKAQGTKYEGFKVQIIDFFEGHYMDHVNSMTLKTESKSIEKDLYGRILSEMFVEGLIKLIKQNLGSESMGDHIAKHFMFFTIGTMGMMSQEAVDD